MYDNILREFPSVPFVRSYIHLKIAAIMSVIMLGSFTALAVGIIYSGITSRTNVMLLLLSLLGGLTTIIAVAFYFRKILLETFYPESYGSLMEAFKHGNVDLFPSDHRMLVAEFSHT